MTIGATAVVVPLLAAGVAAATLVPLATSPAWVDARTATPAPDEPAADGTPVDPGTPAAVASGQAAARATRAAAADERPGHRGTPPPGPAAGHRAPGGSTATGHLPGRPPRADAPAAPAGRPAAHRPTAQRPTAHRPTAHRPTGAGPAGAGPVDTGSAPARPASPRPAAPATSRPGTGGSSGTGAPGSSGTPATDGAAGARPVVTTRTYTDVRRIPFVTRRVEDPALPAGTTRVRVAGEPGSRTLTYEVTTVDGRESGRRLVRDAISKHPVTRVVAVGTRDGCRPDHDDCLYVGIGCRPGEAVAPDDAARLLDDGLVVLDRASLPAPDDPRPRDARRMQDDRKAGGDRKTGRTKGERDGSAKAGARVEPVCETILRWR